MGNHKAGYVNIIGNPNVGKSTLMNRMTGEKLAIITAKAQTTRHRIMGFVNGEDFQIVYSDTPGIIKPGYELQKAMLSVVDMALEDADVLLYVTDVVETHDKHRMWLERIQKTDKPLIVVINKIDLSNEQEVAKMAERWHELFPKAAIIPMSAKHKFNIEVLFNRILEALPESPPYFPKDELTDRPMRFFISEIIREKVLVNYREEVPYSVQVEIEEYVEEKKLTRIRALIHVARDSQKGIIIGKQGMALKKTISQARRDTEEFLQKKVFMEVFVKVTPDWREKRGHLRNFGYLES